MTTNEENTDPLPKVPPSLKSEYEAQAAAMNTPEGRAAAKSAFDADPEVFRRPLNQGDSEEKTKGDS